ncbi:MAG TPA: hypothetical protein VHF06_00080 [Pseudonocardiaceae bacterium]|jgi:hypothetical protein|nr:hypothetical protein [Pseudonocardiaceae bacterium]
MSDVPQSPGPEYPPVPPGGGLGGSSSITTPNTIGSLSTLHDASAKMGNDKATANAQRVAADDAQSAQLLSRAYGGAAATVVHYADGQLANMAVLLVVRADSPEPYERYENLKELGLSVPQREVQHLGDVVCDVVNTVTVTSGQEPADGVQTAACQRTGDGLTVQVRPIGDIAHHPDEVAALVDDAWSGVH